MIENNLFPKAAELLANHNNDGREIAAIDLGSNSFHMIIARIINGSIQILSRLKQQVQLAEGLDENNVLSQAAIQRGVECLALFAERLHGFAPQDVRVVGTYTLRTAVNNQDFLQQAQQVFPYHINIISGQSEAEFIYAGASHTQPEMGRKFVIDIGGGSTEMIIGDDFLPLITQSRHMGCVSFAKHYFPNNIISKAHFEHAYQSAVKKIEDLAEKYQHLGWKSVLGSSGTIKTVTQVISHTINNDGLITRPRLQQLIERVLRADHMNKLMIPGLLEERVNVFVPGLAILTAIFDVFKIRKMRYSDGALREGIIYSLEQGFQVSNIRQRTAKGLMEQFNIDENQAHRVYQTAVLLSQEYQSWNNAHLSQEMRSILLWAAQLHEVGIVINHRGLQHHSAYILQNTELPGFDKAQQELLTTLVRHHIGTFKRRELPKFSRYDYMDVLALIRLLRLAVLLNKSRQATEKAEKFSLKLNRTLTNWQLTFENDYLSRNPLIVQDLIAEKRFLETIGTLKFRFADKVSD
ncbi:exopolyphosphatase [Conservatibacter flavescens]|uniref:Exopolyphosphatase n=1 Tax=Conservatibacter flavescens TaxID=28161 RepID=A0A2M8S4V2_9PAST|nr:exopolyphosphatase [Conservatibacter flavescens]PJG86167.1 exopolyphosphatase [Conservatibacter flavescens]